MAFTEAAVGAGLSTVLYIAAMKHLPEKEQLKEIHMDIAASIQEALNEIVLKIIKNLSREYKISNLCLAGGVALNCVTNSKILKSKYFKKIWIQPASGDAGGALGAALLTWYFKLKNSRKIENSDSMNGSYLGPKYNKKEISDELDKIGAKYKVLSKLLHFVLLTKLLY